MPHSSYLWILKNRCCLVWAKGKYGQRLHVNQYWQRVNNTCIIAIESVTWARDKCVTEKKRNAWIRWGKCWQKSNILAKGKFVKKVIHSYS